MPRRDPLEPSEQKAKKLPPFPFVLDEIDKAPRDLSVAEAATLASMSRAASPTSHDRARSRLRSSRAARIMPGLGLRHGCSRAYGATVPRG